MATAQAAPADTGRFRMAGLDVFYSPENLRVEKPKTGRITNLLLSLIWTLLVISWLVGPLIQRKPISTGVTIFYCLLLVMNAFMLWFGVKTFRDTLVLQKDSGTLLDNGKAAAALSDITAFEPVRKSGLNGIVARLKDGQEVRIGMTLLAFRKPQEAQQFAAELSRYLGTVNAAAGAPSPAGNQQPWALP